MNGLIVGVNISSWHNHVTFFAFQNILCTMKCVGAIIRNWYILLATVLKYISFIQHIIFDEIILNDIAYYVVGYITWLTSLHTFRAPPSRKVFFDLALLDIWFFSIECKLEGYWGQIKRLKMLKKCARSLGKLRLPLQNRV